MKVISDDIIDMEVFRMSKIIHQRDELQIMKNWFLPLQLCQSRTNNSDKNTCTIKALLSGYPLPNLKTLHAIAFDSLLSEEVPSFPTSIDIDNHLHQYQNQHDFS